MSLRLKDARYFSGLIPAAGPDIIISTVSTNITGNASGFIELSLSTLYQMTDSLSLEVIFEPGGGVSDRTLYLEPLLYTFIYWELQQKTIPFWNFPGTKIQEGSGGLVS